MCTSKPKITKAADPVTPAVAPPPEQTAQAPSTGSSNRKDVNQKRKGIAALKIDLNIPGTSGSGMTIPQ